MANPLGAYKINGIPMQGDEMTTGNIFFVDSVTGLSGNDGLSMKSPVTTVDQAINKCTANKGDIIYCMPNHAETIASNTSMAPDVAGISIIGLGHGTDVPTFTYSATSSEITIGADNITFKNLRFVAGISAILVGIDVNGHHFTLENCVMDYSGTTGYDWVDYVDVNGYDYCKIKNNRFIAQNATAGANTGVQFVAAEYIEITGNYFSGDFAEAPIWNTTTASVSILIADNIIYNDDTANADNGISLQAACTGVICRNMIGTLYATDVKTLIDPGSCLCFENYTANAVDEYAIATSLTTASS